MNEQDATRKLVDSLYAQVEESILAAMAAGVPASRIVLAKPEMIHEGHSVFLVAYISFLKM